MDNVVIEDYYHITIMDETNTYIVKFSSKPQGPLLYINLYFNILNALFEDTQQRKVIHLPYVYYVPLMPQIIPLLTLTSVSMWYEEFTPGHVCILSISIQCHKCLHNVHKIHIMKYRCLQLNLFKSCKTNKMHIGLRLDVSWLSALILQWQRGLVELHPSP
jgi:hypothetical protein